VTHRGSAVSIYSAAEFVEQCPHRVAVSMTTCPFDKLRAALCDPLRWRGVTRQLVGLVATFLTGD